MNYFNRAYNKLNLFKKSQPFKNRIILPKKILLKTSLKECQRANNRIETLTCYL